MEPVELEAGLTMLEAGGSSFLTGVLEGGREGGEGGEGRGGEGRGGEGGEGRGGREGGSNGLTTSED